MLFQLNIILWYCGAITFLFYLRFKIPSLCEKLHRHAPHLLNWLHDDVLPKLHALIFVTTATALHFHSRAGSLWFPVKVIFVIVWLAYISARMCEKTLTSFNQNIDLWRTFLAKIVDTPLSVMLEVFVWWTILSPLGLGSIFGYPFKLLVTLYWGYRVNTQIQERSSCHSYERAALYSLLLFSSFMFLVLEDGGFSGYLLLPISLMRFFTFNLPAPNANLQIKAGRDYCKAPVLQCSWQNNGPIRT